MAAEAKRPIRQRYRGCERREVDPCTMHCEPQRTVRFAALQFCARQFSESLSLCVLQTCLFVRPYYNAYDATRSKYDCSQRGNGPPCDARDAGLCGRCSSVRYLFLGDLRLRACESLYPCPTFGLLAG